MTLLHVLFCMNIVYLFLNCIAVSTMTAIKHALQRDIFTPNDERLLGIVNVCKAGKKKKNCFLCATGKDHRIIFIIQYLNCLINIVSVTSSHHGEACPS